MPFFFITIFFYTFRTKSHTFLFSYYDALLHLLQAPFSSTVLLLSYLYNSYQRSFSTCFTVDVSTGRLNFLLFAICFRSACTYAVFLRYFQYNTFYFSALTLFYNFSYAFYIYLYLLYLLFFCFYRLYSDV
jgi:hypothetical protein